MKKISIQNYYYLILIIDKVVFFLYFGNCIPEMKDEVTTITRLKEAGLKLTPQRLALIKILKDNKNHPSADMIYEELKKKYPMVSFSTVYNILNVLKKIGEIKELTIAENKLYYDPNPDPHHHFLCEKCGQIQDIYQDFRIRTEKINLHQVKKHQIYFYGICSDCLKKGVDPKRKFNKVMKGDKK
jgi:Fur family peroxide stress response transcriptional regulator